MAAVDGEYEIKNRRIELSVRAFGEMSVYGEIAFDAGLESIDPSRATLLREISRLQRTVEELDNKDNKTDSHRVLPKTVCKS